MMEERRTIKRGRINGKGGKMSSVVSKLAKAATLGTVYELLDERTKEVRDRFNRLEDRFAEFRSETKQEISEFKSEIRQEISEFKSETKQRFDKVDEQFEKVDERFEKVDERFERLEMKLDNFIQSTNQRFDQLNMRLDQIIGLLIDKRNQ